MKRVLLCFFCLSGIALNALNAQNAQNVLSGIILNMKDHKPIEAASVYINGTAKGVYTDANGNFIISGVLLPCQLVVSHMSYNVELTSIEKVSSEKLTIYLTEKTYQLSTLSLKGNNKRKRNIKEFKESFLGSDYWGENAYLKNDSVLIFSHYVDTIVRKANLIDLEMQNIVTKTDYGSHLSNDSLNVISYQPVFAAKTKSPLIIELPLLGYNVYTDIISFDLRYDNKLKMRKYMECNRFDTLTSVTARQNAKIKKNRQEVYYNSAKHFCKALYDNKLKENGYLIALVKNDVSDLAEPSKRQYFDISPYLSYVYPNKVRVVGLNGKQIDVFYFCKYASKPTNLANQPQKSDKVSIAWKDYAKYNNSYIVFKSDTCVIQSDGRIPDNNILFGGMMGVKAGGTFLPNDYLP